jgi:hypothetical protein
VAGVLLLVALVAVHVLTAPGPLDAARRKYDQIEVGMAEDEVKPILRGWSHEYSWRGMESWEEGWYNPLSGSKIIVNFNKVELDSSPKLTDKQFEEGDQSFRAKVMRLKDRLADKLHHGH